MSCIVSEDHRCQYGKWNKRCQEPERWDDEDSEVFFFYLTISRIEAWYGLKCVFLVGRRGGRKKTRQITDCVDTSKQ